MAALGQPVDLVNCRAVPLAIQREIVANGTLLFTGDADAVAEFQRKATSVLEWTGEGGSLFLSPP
ncbi:MAG: hypothetical protein FJ319_07945 [SAR202 cluster bacterium]|nr:hypothetical protein [SAR202 cluster bacterium]